MSLSQGQVVESPDHLSSETFKEKRRMLPLLNVGTIQNLREALSKSESLHCESLLSIKLMQQVLIGSL
jgi:hypothetical protein